MNEWRDTDAQVNVVGYKQIQREREGRERERGGEIWLDTGRYRQPDRHSHKGASKSSDTGHLY